MADDERRMLFDIRGRRKNVVKVVYAVLALLMGASLFLLGGAGSIGSIFGGDSATSEATSQLEDQAVRIEQKLKKSPDDPQLLLNLTRARINVGNSLSVINPETGETGLTVESRQQLEKASTAWSEYLEATDEPNAGGALVAAPALFSLAQTSRTSAEAESNLDGAAHAQGIVAKSRPSLGSLSTLAIYTFFTFDYPAAEKAGKEAQKYTTTKFARENLENELEEVSKRAHEFQKQVTEFNKASKGQGKESLANPFGGLSGQSSLSGP